MLHPATIEALKPLRTALEAAQATTADLRAKLEAATQQVATVNEGAELVQELARERERITGAAYIAGKAADTKAIDKEHAAAVAALQKRKADADAASAAMPMLIKMLDEAQDAERAAEVALHQVAQQALNEALVRQRSQLHDLADKVIQVIADMVAIGSAADGLASRLTGKDAHRATLAWGLAKNSELLTRSSPTGVPSELHSHVWQLAPGRTREVISELLQHGVDVHGGSLKAPAPPDVAIEPRQAQTFIVGSDGQRIPVLQAFGQIAPVATSSM